MGIFDRFSRLVRAELNHRTGGRSAVDPASWRASEPGDKGPPEPRAEVLPPELTRAFEVLGVDPRAERATTRAAYLKALKAHHPDRHQDDERARVRATDESARINQAWDLLERYYEVQSNSTT
jgi:DnaJ-domain-containing protein 1